MKPVQIMMDPELLEALDATEEVRAEGRSAVLRRVVREYLAHARRMEVRERYRQAYGGGEGLGKEFDGWADQARGPDE